MTNTGTLIGTTRNGEPVTVSPVGDGTWWVAVNNRYVDRFDSEDEARRDAEYYVPADADHSLFVAERALLGL